LNLLQSDCDIFDGVFLFMKFETKTRIELKWVVIKIYRNGEYYFTYDFLIENAKMMLDEHLPTKRWATTNNLIEIRKSIEQQINLN